MIGGIGDKYFLEKSASFILGLGENLGPILVIARELHSHCGSVGNWS